MSSDIGCQNIEHKKVNLYSARSVNSPAVKKVPNLFLPKLSSQSSFIATYLFLFLKSVYIYINIVYNNFTASIMCC